MRVDWHSWASSAQDVLRRIRVEWQSWASSAQEVLRRRGLGTKYRLSHWDLVLSSVFGVAAVVAVTLNLPSLFRIVPAIPLVLFLPGYVVSAAILPGGLSRAETLAVAIATSICLAILIGLALGRSPVGLNPVSWTVSLAAFTVLTAMLARWARARRGVQPPTVRLRRPIGVADLAVVGFVILAVTTVIWATRSVAQEEAPPPAQLWLVPSEEDPLTARLGMRAGAQGGDYSMRITSRGQLVSEFSQNLAPGEQWQIDVAFSPDQRAGPLVARLYEGEALIETRFVVLQPPVNGLG